MKTFFFLNFHKNNVISDLTDTFPGDDVFAFTSEKAAEFSGSRDDQRGDAAGLAVKFQINGTAKTSAGTGVDDFFLFQFT